MVTFTHSGLLWFLFLVFTGSILSVKLNNVKFGFLISYFSILWLDFSSVLVAPSVGKQSGGQCYIDIDPPALQLQVPYNLSLIHI